MDPILTFDGIITEDTVVDESGFFVKLLDTAVDLDRIIKMEAGSEEQGNLKDFTDKLVTQPVPGGCLLEYHDPYDSFPLMITVYQGPTKGTYIRGDRPFRVEFSELICPIDLYTLPATVLKALENTEVTITDTTPSSAKMYYPIYSEGLDGMRTVRANKDLYYYDTGAASYFNIGSSNQLGGLTLHQNNGKYTNLLCGTPTANRNVNLPDADGTLVTKEQMDAAIAAMKAEILAQITG